MKYIAGLFALPFFFNIPQLRVNKPPVRCVGQHDRFHRFAFQAHLFQRIQRGLGLVVIPIVNQNHLAGRGRNDPNRNHAVLHLLNIALSSVASIIRLTFTRATGTVRKVLPYL